MIGKLKGILDSICDDHIILDVQGVGYSVFVSNRLLSSLPTLGEHLNLFIETHVRAEAIRLFGFTTKAERDWFCLLQNVPGVGAKVALAILGTLSPGELAQAIALNDVAMIKRTPGIGQKVSERIISEFKNKTLPFNEGSKNTAHLASNLQTQETNQPVNDALSALIKLGFDRDQAAQALSCALSNLEEETVSSALLIRHSLKLLSNSSNTR
ncbi:Holliday junction branch migration protein RuvA [Bartonella sp. WD12.1]|uniref:Holliday junction branch migration protein RuvA n=1 Tax=Bartonella sp. WD12.1 TaxID=1933903 RepID=UPI00099917F2|nr:Holliday junction branch migration protein RuvA [Bartonella sp. WD12.1]OPB30232.1 Holliday junction DNA helicase subunit RuvA [Bartonella sp. WD12.1]